MSALITYSGPYTPLMAASSTRVHVIGMSNSGIALSFSGSGLDAGFYFSVPAAIELRDALSAAIETMQASAQEMHEAPMRVPGGVA